MFNKLITINYSGGTGGEFMAHAITSSLNNSLITVNSDSHNKFVFERKQKQLSDRPDIVLTMNPQYIYMLHNNELVKSRLLDLFSHLPDEPPPAIKRYVDDYEFYKYTKSDDQNDMKLNIINTIRRMYCDTDNYQVLTFHNLKYNEIGLSLQNIYPHSINLAFTTSLPENLVLFWFLGWYKNNRFVFLDNVDAARSFEKFLETSINCPSDPYFHNEEIVFMDKLIFDPECIEYERLLNERLSNLTGKSVVIDHSALQTYRENNTKIIKDFFKIPENQSIIHSSVIELVNNFIRQNYGKSKQRTEHGV
jgi:hypothetical protein